MFSWITKRYAKSIAKTQLGILQKIKEKNPDLLGRDLYKQVLFYRPGYDSKKIENIIEEAEEELKKPWRRNPNQTEINFRDVVYTLIMNEYMQTQPVNKNLVKQSAQSSLIILMTVEEIIPSEL